MGSLENVICAFSVEGWYEGVKILFLPKIQDTVFWAVKKEAKGITFDKITEKVFEEVSNQQDLFSISSFGRQIYIPKQRIILIEEVGEIDETFEFTSGVASILGGLSKLDFIDQTPPSEKGIVKTQHNYWLSAGFPTQFINRKMMVRFPLSNNQKNILENNGFPLNVEKVIL